MEVTSSRNWIGPVGLALEEMARLAGTLLSECNVKTATSIREHVSDMSFPSNLYFIHI